MKILVTGGTVFVSRFAAEYFIARGHEVFALNRNTRPQPLGARLIEADRNDLRDKLKGYNFDAVVDVNAYNADDVNNLLDALDGYGKYVMISSSAVYPETTPQPFSENALLGPNKYWGEYGTGKISAERALSARDPNAYIIRPPYIYGEYNNVYREAFAFDCAMNDLPMYIPADSSFKLQFVHVEDVCRFIEILIDREPSERIYNIGTNPITALEWIKACYAAAGKVPSVNYVDKSVEQRNYFPFYAYSYALDCARAKKLMPDLIGAETGFKRAYTQYSIDDSNIKRKNYLQYIRENLMERE